MIRMVVEVGGECGLCINKGKSSVPLFNYRKGKPDKIGGMKLVSSIRYLRTDVGDSRFCFGECQPIVEETHFRQIHFGVPNFNFKNIYMKFK